MNQKKIDKCFTDHTLPKDPNMSFMINGIQFANRKEYDKRVQHDAEAMARLLYDIINKRSVRNAKLRIKKYLKYVPHPAINILAPL